MSQMCISPKTEHIPAIERYYDTEQPLSVLRLFRCELCGMLMDRDLVDRRTDDGDDLYDPEFVPTEETREV